MRLSISRFLALLALVPALLLGMVTLASPANAAAVSPLTLQADVYRLTNYQRARAGCSALRLDSHLMLAARAHSGWMAQHRTMSHIGRGGSTFVSRIETAGYSAPRSENVAFGYRTGAELMNAWMHSAGHRANILDCRAKAVAVAAVYASDGSPYYTQDFGAR